MEGVSLQPKQFRQQTLWPTAAETTHVAGGARPIEMGGPSEDRRVDQRGQVEFRTRGTYPEGGSWSSWNSPHILKRSAEIAAQKRSTAARERELGSGQRAMFMTPREIHARYQPLDGDRYDSSAGSHEFSTSGGFAMTTGSPDRIARENEMETDDELWDRKLEESQYSKRDYAMDRGEGVTGTGTFVDRLYDRDSGPVRQTGHTETWEAKEESYVNRKIGAWRESHEESLYDSIAKSGVRSPIRLGEAEGMMGKPEIVGGHHRLAAQTDLNQDQFVPVLHHEDIGEARSKRTERGYKYT